MLRSFFGTTSNLIFIGLWDFSHFVFFSFFPSSPSFSCSDPEKNVGNYVDSQAFWLERVYQRKIFLYFFYFKISMIFSWNIRIPLCMRSKKTFLPCHLLSRLCCFVGRSHICRDTMWFSCQFLEAKCQKHYLTDSTAWNRSYSTISYWNLMHPP